MGRMWSMLVARTAERRAAAAAATPLLSSRPPSTRPLSPSSVHLGTAVAPKGGACLAPAQGLRRPRPREAVSRGGGGGGRPATAHLSRLPCVWTYRDCGCVCHGRSHPPRGRQART
jgi:hypothetical protein